LEAWRTQEYPVPDVGDGKRTRFGCGGPGKELLAIMHYTSTLLGAKGMIVVYREDKQLIITAFFSLEPI